MPRITGHFDIYVQDRTLTFTSSESSARIIDRVIHEMSTHDSLKKIPAELLIDFLCSPCRLAAGESIADSESAVIQAVSDAAAEIDSFTDIISGSYCGLSLDEAVAWHKDGIIPPVFNMRAAYSTEYIIFTTGRNMTLTRLQEIADKSLEKLHVYSWGHIFDDSLGSRIRVTVFGRIYD